MKQFAITYVAIRNCMPNLRHRVTVRWAVSETEAIGIGHLWAEDEAPSKEGWQVVSVLALPLVIMNKEVN